MKAVSDHPRRRRLNERLAISGFRFTPQRQHVYRILMHKRDHPTADEVFVRAKHGMPEISMATVYNCLDALVKSGLVRQVNLDRSATRFCPNMHEHCHFCCDGCGRVFDIAYETGTWKPSLPPGFRPRQFDLSIRGLCARCGSRARTQP